MTPAAARKLVAVGAGGAFAVYASVLRPRNGDATPTPFHAPSGRASSDAGS